MAWQSLINTSLFGRRFGLQNGTTNVTGGSVATDYLVGPADLRKGVTTAETTSANLAAHGVSWITSSVSSGVYTLDPPVPGVTKVLHFTSTGNSQYLKTANGEFFSSSQGTTFSVLKSTSNVAGDVMLVGVSTGVWGVLSGVSTGTFAFSTTT